MKLCFSRFFILLGIGLLLLGVYFLEERNNPNRLQFTYNTSVNTIHYFPKNIQPVLIDISSVHIHLPIYPATIDHTIWDTTTRGASYLITSPVPGDKGNAIIYGHNWTSLMGNLIYIKPGDKINVILNNKTQKTFTVRYTSIVLPTDIAILYPSKDNRLTLYTCTGFFDEKRFVSVAMLDR